MKDEKLLFISFGAAITPWSQVPITIQFYVQHRHFGGAVNSQFFHISNDIVYRW